MLLTILMLLLGLVIFAGFFLAVSYWSFGFIAFFRAKATKRKEEQIRRYMLPRERREARIRYLDSLLAEAEAKGREQEAKK